MQRTDTERIAMEREHYAEMRDVVEATNLVGVITQALVSTTGPLLEAVAARIAWPQPIRRSRAVRS